MAVRRSSCIFSPLLSTIVCHIGLSFRRFQDSYQASASVVLGPKILRWQTGSVMHLRPRMGRGEGTDCYRAARSTQEITGKAFSDVAEKSDAPEV